MNFTTTKSPVRSVTIIASAVGAIVSMLSAVGLHIAPGVVSNANDIITGVAALIAIYGRFRAKTLIT